MASFSCAGHLVRRFTTSSVRHKLVTAEAWAQIVCKDYQQKTLAGIQPPIQFYDVAGRYATALYSAATKQKQLDVVEKELTNFGNLLKTDAKLNEFIKNPSLQRTEKKAAMEKVLKHQKYSSITSNFFNALTENGRLAKAETVLKCFAKIMSAHRGEILCTITTASPLDGGSQKELTSALQGFAQKGQILQIEMKVDPSIMGGMVVNIGDKYIDMSTSSKIRKYTKLIEAGL